MYVRMVTCWEEWNVRGLMLCGFWVTRRFIKNRNAICFKNTIQIWIFRGQVRGGSKHKLGSIILERTTI